MIQVFRFSDVLKHQIPYFRPCVLGLALLAVLVVYGPQARAQSLPDTIDQILPSIVSVGAVTQGKRQAGRLYGTGFVVGDGYHVVTNYHVIDVRKDLKQDQVLTVFAGQGARVSAMPFTVVVEDPVHDLALLKIVGRWLPAMEVVASEGVRAGQLFAFTGFPIGNALGQHPATHRGIVAAIPPIVTPQANARQLKPEHIKRSRKPFSVFQLDAIAYPGNSGSPLYDPQTGEVVGVINSVFVKQTKESVLSEPSAITYAIPSRFVLEMMREAGLSGQ